MIADKLSSAELRIIGVMVASLPSKQQVPVRIWYDALPSLFLAGREKGKEVSRLLLNVARSHNPVESILGGQNCVLLVGYVRHTQEVGYLPRQQASSETTLKTASFTAKCAGVKRHVTSLAQTGVANLRVRFPQF